MILHERWFFLDVHTIQVGLYITLPVLSPSLDLDYLVLLQVLTFLIILVWLYFPVTGASSPNIYVYWRFLFFFFLICICEHLPYLFLQKYFSVLLVFSNSYLSWWYQFMKHSGWIKVVHLGLWDIKGAWLKPVWFLVMFHFCSVT